MTNEDGIVNEKIIDKIKKLFLLAESEKELGNEGAAITIGEKAQELLQKYKLDISLLSKEEQRVAYIEIGNELGKSVVENPIKRANAVASKARTVWFEKLAKVVGDTYYCKVGFIRQKGAVSFYGYELDRQIAVFMFGKLVDFAHESCKEQAKILEAAINKQGISKGISAFSKKVVELPKVWMGEESFTNSFHAGFRTAVEEKYNSHRNENIKNEDVEFYYNSASGREKENPYYDDFTEPFIDKYVYELGYKFAIKISNKASSVAQKKASTSQALVGTRIKVVFIGNAFLLIDTSGSMHGGSKMTEAKEGSINFAKDVLLKGFSPGIITFGAHVGYGEESNQIKLVLDCQNEVDSKFQSAVNELIPGGSTPMTEAIYLATSLLTKKSGRKVICVVTDGEPDNKVSALYAAEMAKNQGIEIFAVGTDGARQDFLDQLVSKKGQALLTDNLSGGIQKMAGMLTA